MTTCPPFETLERLLGGELPDGQAAGLHRHLEGCAACQAILDQLSDDPELRRCAGRTPPRRPPDGPGLARALARLSDAPVVDSGHDANDRPDDEPLSFLGPPLQPGDLGSLGPYRVLRELGRGGMGVVLLASDPGLERRVALKVLLPHRAGPKARAQFVREARAAAAIDHDHVLPVHAVVSPADGPPYLVMPYVDGPTLRERIRTEKRLDPVEAARIGRQVAEGLAAAHRAGLVHRDIKPANVLLDAVTGRAKVVDFGLVRTAAPTDGDTPDGAVPGTPEYMSPEQVREPDRVDARTDVYGLGVTLYEALTGDVPFRGVPHLVLQQVVSDEPRPPRRLNDRVPRDLETVVLTAMAKEPARRYQSAAALADDLGRWLNGESIRARPPGPAGKLWRWCRRNPALAGLTAALALVAAGSFAAVTSLWLTAAAERGRAEASARAARQSLADARSAVHEHFVLLSETQLSEESDMPELRKKLLEAALAHFQRFLREHPGDPDLVADVADAHDRVAAITSRIGSKAEALAEYRRASALYETLARANPDDPRPRRDLAQSHYNVGQLLFETGQPAEALRSYEQARDLFDALDRAGPGDAHLRGQLAATFNATGRARLETGQSAEALRLYEQARDLRAELARADSGNAALQAELARSHLNVGTLLSDIGQPAEALRAYRLACDLFGKLALADPAAREVQAGLAGALNNLGLLQQQSGQLAEALGSLEKARDVRERLARVHPTVTPYQRGLADSLVNLSLLHWEAGRADEALQSGEQAVAVFEKLARANPAAPQFRFRLAQGHLNLGLLHQQAGRAEEALRHFESARAAFGDLVRAHPAAVEYRSRLGAALNSLGNAREKRGQSEEAVAAYREAAAQQRVAFDKAPRVTQYRLLLDRHCFDLARALRGLGRLEEAAAALAECEALWPDDAAKLCGVAGELARCAERAGQGEAQARYADRAIDVLRRAIARGFKDAERLRKDPAFDALRSRGDFQELLAALAGTTR